MFGDGHLVVNELSGLPRLLASDLGAEPHPAFRATLLEAGKVFRKTSRTNGPAPKRSATTREAALSAGDRADLFGSRTPMAEAGRKALIIGPGIGAGVACRTPREPSLSPGSLGHRGGGMDVPHLTASQFSAMLGPMRYPGGKGRCYKHIISLMRPHDVYIETHLGGGAVMLKKRPAKRSIGIEIDPLVLETWKANHGADGLDLINGDAVAFLRGYDFEGGELVYADPPYLPSTRRRERVYRYDYTVEQHLELLATLRTLPCAVVISGYRSDLYDEALAGWVSVDFPGDSHTGARTEVAWLNYLPSDALHDYRHIGGGFREREAIKRRRAGLTERIGRLPSAERSALFEELAAQHEADLRRALERAP